MHATIGQCRSLLSLAETILAGLDDSYRALEPQPGAKTAGRLIGHLAVSGDFAGRLCGRPAICPGEWRPLFNPGSQPATDPGAYPSMEQLCAVFRDVYADLCAAAQQIDSAALAAAIPLRRHGPPFRPPVTSSATCRPAILPIIWVNSARGVPPQAWPSAASGRTGRLTSSRNRTSGRQRQLRDLC